MVKTPLSRQERLAQALRENLKRRKGDLRKRETRAKGPSAAAPPEDRLKTAEKNH